MAAEFVARTFEQSDHSNETRYVWSHIRRHKTVGLLMLFGAFCNAALASAVPIFAGRAVNAILQDEDLVAVRWFALAIILSQLSRGGLQFMRNFSAETFAQRIERDVRDELYVSLLGKSMTFHAFQPVGEIMARVTNDVREVNLMMSPGLNLVIGSGMFILLPLVATPLIHPALVLTPLAFVILYILAQFQYLGSLQKVAQQVRASFGQMNAHLAETLDGIEVVKGTAQESYEISRFDTLTETVKRGFVKQGDIEAQYFPILLWGLAFAVGFLHSVYLFRAGEIESGDIVGFVGQIGLFGFPVFTSIFSISRIASGHASAGRILNIITTKTDLDQNEQGHEGHMQGAVTLKNINFGYLAGKEILHNISFDIQPGQTIAIVGQTGSGKSTLTKLINRTYDVTQGQVLVDGIDVRDWTLASLRSQISIIEQEIFLFSRSIADNIRFGKPEASMEEVMQAAHSAQAHEFIMRFPEGYETIIGQRGVTLSGGQRQRLAIARAFLTDPRILILDDSTSAIDSATEDKIQQAIWAAAEGRTTILITHRLSQIRWADHIVVLRQGKVSAQGKHEDLLKTSDSYRRIFARYEQ